MAVVVKNLPASAGDIKRCSSIPGSRGSPGEGKGYPLRYSGLQNCMDCIVHEVVRSQTRLRNFHFSLKVDLKLQYWRLEWD